MLLSHVDFHSNIFFYFKPKNTTYTKAIHMMKKNNRIYKLLFNNKYHFYYVHDFWKMLNCLFMADIIAFSKHEQSSFICVELQVTLIYRWHVMQASVIAKSATKKAFVFVSAQWTTQSNSVYSIATFNFPRW